MGARPSALAFARSRAKITLREFSSSWQTAQGEQFAPGLEGFNCFQDFPLIFKRFQRAGYLLNISDFFHIGITVQKRINLFVNPFIDDSNLQPASAGEMSYPGSLERKALPHLVKTDQYQSGAPAGP